MGERCAIDGARSRVTARTRAKGLMARLAHDLVLESRALRGEGERDGEVLRGRVGLDVDSLQVVGAGRGGTVDRGVLSAADVQEVERRVRVEVFRAGRTIVVESTID